MSKKIAAVLPVGMMLATYLAASFFGRLFAEPGELVNSRDYSYVISTISIAAYLIGFASHDLYKKMSNKKST